MDASGQNSLNKLRQEAIAHERASNWPAAEATYQQIIEINQADSASVHSLALLMLQSKRIERAIPLLERAIELAPNEASFHCNLGGALVLSNRLTDAILAYQKALHLDPTLAGGHNGLGNALRLLNRPNEAVTALSTALKLRRDYPEALFNLGHALIDQKQWDRAIEAFRGALRLNYRRVEVHHGLANALMGKGDLRQCVSISQTAARLSPDDAESHRLLGVALWKTGDLQGAQTALHRAVALQPGSAAVHNNLAGVLRERGHLLEAIGECRQATALAPNEPMMHYNLGTVLLNNGQYELAVPSFHEALDLKPDLAMAHTNLGSALHSLGEYARAEQSLRQAIKLEPDNPLFHYNLSTLLLRASRFEEGWHEYEWRIRMDPDSSRKESVWDGAPLNGGTLSVTCEQGYGDTIQFARYLPLLGERASAKIVLECPPELAGLLECLSDVQILLTGSRPLQASAHVSLLSLPYIFGTTLPTIPFHTPYLRPDARCVERWRQRSAHDANLKVGLAWAGRSDHENDRNRSIPAAAMASLARAGKVTFVSLQKGPAAAQVRELGLGTRIVDWTAELDDFADTAALIENLELVITVDTAVAHLAGAMGKPVWLLLPFVPDWRWMLDREDSPWYPTMRLFRQSTGGDWNGVIERVVGALKGLSTE